MIFDFSREVKTLTSERERKEAMIDHIVRPEVEKAIREAGLNPSYFILNKASEQEFFNRPFSDTQEDGSFASMYYDWITPDTLYRCECRIELSWDFLTVKAKPICIAWSTILKENRNGNISTEKTGKWGRKMISFPLLTLKYSGCNKENETDGDEQSA